MRPSTAACVHGVLHDVNCVNLLQTALVVLTQPKLPQPQLAEAAPAPASQLAAAAATVATMPAAPNALMSDMGEGWLPASRLAELAGAPGVATRASGAHGSGHAPAPMQTGAHSMGARVGSVEAGGMQPASSEPPSLGALQDPLPH
jgi:hypothetical protein